MADRKAFQSIADAPATPKPSKAELAQFAAERGAPSLGKTHAAPKMVADAPPQPRAISRLNMEIPASLRPQLRRRAVDEDSTIASVVLRALKKDGFDIADEDLVLDRRHSA